VNSLNANQVHRKNYGHCCQLKNPGSPFFIPFHDEIPLRKKELPSRNRQLDDREGKWLMPAFAKNTVAYVSQQLNDQTECWLTAFDLLCSWRSGKGGRAARRS